MTQQAITIGLLLLFAVALPGPDFALVTKNTLVHSRRSGLFTALGISLANLIHLTYCILGLALVIAKSSLFFNIIKYLGAIYLIYLGIKSLCARNVSPTFNSAAPIKKSRLSDMASLKQGFLCNLLNPKATLFFLALFTTVIRPQTPPAWLLLFVVEIFLIVLGWFISLTFILSHPKITLFLEKAEPYIEKILGIFLIVFGIALAFFHH